MCAILAIVQYEVYSLKDGRWVVHARYPGDERKEAIKEAMATEEITRRPTRVIKDTYYPHENRNEPVNIYTSPRIKELTARMKTQPFTPISLHSYRVIKQQAAKPVERSAPAKLAPRAADIFWRAIITSGLSLTAAAIVTAMVSWMLSRLPDFGMHIDPSRTSAILTLTYISVFLLGIFSLFRFGNPIKRLIASLWQTTASYQAQMFAASLPYRFKLKPKRPSQPQFEQAEDAAEVKRLRGDPETLAPSTHGQRA